MRPLTERELAERRKREREYALMERGLRLRFYTGMLLGIGLGLAVIFLTHVSLR